MNLLEKIKTASQASHTETVECRRWLHANPELSFEEFNTAAFVVEKLESFGISASVISGTGVVALIEGKNPSARVVALRADMDALPIQELNEVGYRSGNPGVMHACGHDVHTASLLTTAKILQGLKNDFEGTIKLIFQPGEEKHPGGASVLIKAGVLENPKPNAIIGQHVFPVMKAGKAGFRSGKYMASSDEIRLVVKGKGGHASTPDLNIDPVLIAAHIVVALQQVISRNASPRQPTVLSFGKVTANGATNVIPDEVSLEGTFRALDENWRKTGLEKIARMATGIAESMGATCEVNISHGYPTLHNEPRLTDRLRRAASEYLGQQQVEEIDLTLGSEDFAYYSQEIPATFYRLGTRNETKGITSYVHTPTFDIDEDALAIGPGLMAWLALKELEVKD
jgi:amidohydrolase